MPVVKMSNAKMSNEVLIGASLSEPHTSGLQCKMCVYVCLCVAIYRKFKFERMDFKFVHMLKQVHVR